MCIERRKHGFERGRVRQLTRLPTKPGFLRLATTPYEEPQVPAAPPMTIWEERDQQPTAIATRNGQQQMASLGQPAGQQTLGW